MGSVHPAIASDYSRKSPLSRDHGKFVLLCVMSVALDFWSFGDSQKRPVHYDDRMQKMLDIGDHWGFNISHRHGLLLQPA